MNFGKRVDEVSYYYLNDGKIKSYDVANVDIKDIKNKILDKIKVIQKNKSFHTTRSRLCDHCDFKEICPAFAPPRERSFGEASPLPIYYEYE